MKKLAFYLSICFMLPIFCADVSQDQAIATYRYEAIKKLLKKYKRPFTFMELWAQQGDLSFSVAQKYKNSVCVMTESAQSDLLVQRCKTQAALSNVIALNIDLSIEDLISLGECEHIDVVMVPNLHRFKDEWKKAFDAALTLGDHIIIEAQFNDQKLAEKVEAYCLKHGGECLETPPAELSKYTGKLYLFSMNKKYILRRRWKYSKECNLGEYTIKSSFEEKKLIKEKKRPEGHSVTEWHPGINLFTFKKLNGSYPSKELIRSLLLPLGKIDHNDLRIFNIIIQGTQIVPIDCNENGRKNTAKQLLPYLLNQFRNKFVYLADLYAADCVYLEKLDIALNY